LVLAPAGSVDVVLTFRNSHGWFRDDQQEQVYGAAFEALKPGGVFGVVQHRANEGADPKETAPKGYLPEAAVISAAEAVGFTLAEKSEINANAKDTKDHPEGVWTLPPGYALEDKDRDKYAAIGESDRMTLKFVKPAN
jgi:predicted methyltransferase